MARTKDYDDALAGMEPIRVTIKGEAFTFQGDPPAGMVIEWYAKNTTFDASLNQGEKLEANWRLIFGDEYYDRFVELGVGGRTLDALYSDLLDWWHIVRKAKTEDMGGLSAEVWENMPPSIHTEVRQYVIQLEDRIDELETELGLDEPAELASVGEATG